jgi:curved DNA-binding protein
MKDYYSILGVGPTASEDEIRRAYRILARRYHPDSSSETRSEDRFKEISEAYSILGDTSRRGEYELERSQSSQRAKPSPRQPSTSQRPYEHFERTNGHAKSSSPQVWDASKQSSGISLSKILSPTKKLLSSVKLRLMPQASRKGVALHEVSVSVPEALGGCEKIVDIRGRESNTQLKVRIPPGVRPGSVLHLRGGALAQGITDEEIIIIIRIRAHSFLSVHAKGVVCEIPISIIEAINGARVKVPTFEESAIITIPPHTQSGQEFRLKSKGAALRDGRRGDLYVRTLIMLPSPAEAKTFAQRIAIPLTDATLRGHIPEQLPGW